jgi:hypothetical protein
MRDSPRAYSPIRPRTETQLPSRKARPIRLLTSLIRYSVNSFSLLQAGVGWFLPQLQQEQRTPARKRSRELEQSRLRAPMAEPPPQHSRMWLLVLAPFRPLRHTATPLLHQPLLRESEASHPQLQQEQLPQLPTLSMELGRSRPRPVMVTETRPPLRWTVPVTLPVRAPGPRTRPRHRLPELEAFPRPPL